MPSSLPLDAPYPVYIRIRHRDYGRDDPHKLPGVYPNGNPRRARP